MLVNSNKYLTSLSPVSVGFAAAVTTTTTTTTPLGV